VNVTVPMMQVRVMGMPMCHRLMFVNMHVRFTGGIIGPMFMLMMFVVSMAVGMFHRLMDMLVIVPFRQMQEKTDAHQNGGDEQLAGDRLAKQHHRQHRAYKGCC